MKLQFRLPFFRNTHEKKGTKLDVAKAELALICKLPYETAREKAFKYLVENPDFFLEPASSDDFLPPELPEGLRDLYTHYREVNWSGITQVGLSYWEPLIGTTDQFIIGYALEAELVIESNKESLLMCDDEEFTMAYPSIFHLIIHLAS